MVETRYITVDLLIESESDLTEISDYFEGRVLFIYKDITATLSRIGIETNSIESVGPDEDIMELLNLVNGMPKKLQNQWEDCTSKILDIGYECGDTMDTLDSFLSANILLKISQYGCAINIRIYPHIERPSNNDDIVFVNSEP